jgi:4-amino-4-deoxy-L-arabinose transferase-like glycosyltransferase
VTRRAPSADRTRAAAILWGTWLLVTGAVLSFAGGIIHTYYTVELAPAIAALVAIGVVVLWRARASQPARLVLAAGSVATGLWTYALLRRTPSFHPWVGYVVVIAAVAVAALVLTSGLRRAAVAVIVTAGVVTLGGGSAAYALDTAATPHTGSVPSAGPAAASGFSGLGRPGGTRDGFPGGTPPTGAGGAQIGERPTGPGGVAPGGTAPGGTAPGGSSATAGRMAGGGGMPGGGGASVSSALTKLLKATDTTWAAAAVGSQEAGPLELASGKAVMSIGGFNGGDAAPTLAQFKAYVGAGQIRYFIGGGTGGGPGGGGGSGSAISQWVAANFTSTTVGNTTVYDLTKAATS